VDPIIIQSASFPNQIMFTNHIHRNIDFSGVSPISHEHSWPVISAFFEKEGLVSQQLSSFNYFINNLKKIVSEAPHLDLTPNKQYHVTDTPPIVRTSFFYIFHFNLYGEILFSFF
jgi:DNA-directed RNA polymerase beta subunit